MEKILLFYKNRGHEEYHGESVSQIEHAVQSAVLARSILHDDKEFILAAFLHDIGHLVETKDTEETMGHFGVRSHEAKGADLLREHGLSEKICRLVAGHVTAKRYLVSTNPDYFHGLSEASKITLIHQGGMMTEAEREVFESDDLFDLHLKLRRLDEQSKIVGQPIDADLAWIKEMLYTASNS